MDDDLPKKDGTLSGWMQCAGDKNEKRTHLRPFLLGREPQQQLCTSQNKLGCFLPNLTKWPTCEYERAEAPITTGPMIAKNERRCKGMEAKDKR